MLAETKQLLVDKHEFEPRRRSRPTWTRSCTRFANPYLPDTAERVGRQPLRKLSRHERLIGPAAELAERGISPHYLLATVDAALLRRARGPGKCASCKQLLRTLTPEEATERITGLAPEHPLYPEVLAVLEPPDRMICVAVIAGAPTRVAARLLGLTGPWPSGRTSRCEVPYDPFDLSRPPSRSPIRCPRSASP